MKHTLQIFVLLTLIAGSLRAEDAKVTDGKMTPSQAPQQQDRMMGSKAAAKAAAAGAAMGKVNCMMMMKEAMKEADKQTKMMMMMVASQQCMQASELEKSAAENDKGRKELSQADIPKQAKFEAGKMELQGEIKEAKITFDDNAPSRAPGESPADEIAIAPTFKPDLNANKGAPVAAEGEPKEKLQAQATPPATPLDPIDKGKLQFDDSQKNAGLPLTSGAGFMPLPNTSMGSQGGGSSNAGATQVAAEEGPSRGGRRSGISSEAGPSASGGSDAGERGGKGEEAFDALMSQLMGEPGDGESLEGGAGQMWNGGDAAPAERANIFEYATLRFSKLKTEDKRLGKNPVAKPAADRSLASAK